MFATLRAGVLGLGFLGFSLLWAGCDSTSTGKPKYAVPAAPGCTVPELCDAYQAKHPRELKIKLLKLFDQLEMSSGEGNEQRALPVMSEMEVMLKACPKLILPELIAQVQRPVHELERAYIATVLGWYEPGKSCSVPVLEGLLRDPVPLVRFQAAGALLDLQERAGIDVLLNEALVHDNPIVRARALQALSDFSGQRLEDRDAALRWSRGAH